MWTILEQYSFLKPMFSLSSGKARETTILGTVATGITMVVTMFNYWANEVLGMTVWVCLMIFVIMFIDLITGVASAAIKEGRDSLCSKKGLRWVFKFGSYTVFIYVLNSLVKEAKVYDYYWITEAVTVVKLFVIFKICFWEMKSIDENFEKMGYSFRIFKLLDSIYNIFKSAIKKNANVDIDAVDKPTDEK